MGFSFSFKLDKYEQKLQEIWTKQGEVNFEKRMQDEEESANRILASFMKRTNQFKP